MALPALAALAPLLTGAGAGAGAAGMTAASGPIGAALSNPNVIKAASVMQGAAAGRQKADEQAEKAAEPSVAQMIPQVQATSPTNAYTTERRLKGILS